MATLKLFDLAPSPNNIKIRLALGYKGIDYERIPIALDDAGREAVIEATGQPLTPAIAHGEVRLFDSSAILRYIDANFRDRGPRLYATSREEMREIEDWEAFAREDATAPVALTFGQAMAGAVDPARKKEANEALARVTARLEERLSESEWLVGDAMTAADIQVAPFVFCGMLPPEAAAAGGVVQFFAEHLRAPEDHAKTRAWAGRVMAFDR